MLKRPKLIWLALGSLIHSILAIRFIDTHWKPRRHAAIAIGNVHTDLRIGVNDTLSGKGSNWIIRKFIMFLTFANNNHICSNRITLRCNIALAVALYLYTVDMCMCALLFLACLFACSFVLLLSALQYCMNKSYSFGSVWFWYYWHI